MEHVNITRWWAAGVIICWLAACSSTQPAATPSPIAAEPGPTLIVIGVESGAQSLPSLIAYAPPGAQPRYVTTSQESLRRDLQQGTLDAILVYDVPAEPPERYFNPVVLDGVVLIVHPDNPIITLSMGELQAIYSGRITDWGAVGGVGGSIEVLGRDGGSGARGVFDERVLNGQRMTINARIEPDPQAVIAAVAEAPGAIGYVTAGSLPEDSDVVRVVAIDGVSPTTESLAEQAYPLTMVLYWVSATEPVGEARALLAWLQSAEGQSALGARFGRIR